MALGLMLTLSVSSVLAGNENVSPRILESFKKDFAAATDVSWDSGKNFIRASFTLGIQKVFAFYSEEGEMISVARYISTLQLPFRLFTNLKNQYSHYWISDVVEVNNEYGTKYYVTLENAETKLVLNSGISGSWSVHSKNKKA